MAKRKYKKGNKIQPAVQTLVFKWETDGATDTRFIDLSQSASLMNRRFYRQGLNWAVAGMKLITTDSGSVQICKLPNTWVMSNAWEKSFRAWQHMIRNATEDAGSQSIKGKFLDFKIYADHPHAVQGVNKNLLPWSCGTSAYPTGVEARRGQWDMSVVEIPVTQPAGSVGPAVTYELIACGANHQGAGASGVDSVSVIQGYADSRGLPDIEDPNVPAHASGNWMMKLFSDGTQQDEEVTNMLETTGDKAPYPFEGDGTYTDTQYPGGEVNMPGLQVHSSEQVTATTVGGITRFKGGNFPCGLIAVMTSVGDEKSMYLEVDLVPGHHRGYLCESMTEM